jgi:5'-nucleotidase
VPWIRDDTLVTRGPFRVGIIGVTTRSTKTDAKASNIAGLRFDDPAPIVDSLAALLRRQGANKIVVVAHAGAFCDSTGQARCNGEVVTMAEHLTQPVDVVVSGHTHSLVNTVVNGIPVVQARSSGTAIDVVDLPLAARPALLREVRDVLPDSGAADRTIAHDVDVAEAAVATQINRRIAVVGEDISNIGNNAPLGNLVADAMRAAGNADLGAMNHGGVRVPLRAGVATYGSVFEVQPFANILYKVTARGVDMRRYLERIVAGPRPQVWLSGALVTVDTTRPAGNRITKIELWNGRVLDDSSAYSIVINDFMLTNNGVLAFPGTPLSSQPLNTDLDALVAYLEAAPQPVGAPKDPRVRIVTGQSPQ